MTSIRGRRSGALAVALGALVGCGTTPVDDAEPVTTVDASVTAVTSVTPVLVASEVAPQPSSTTAPVRATATDEVIDTGGALATTTAVRSPATTVGAQCDLETIAALASRHPDASQLIVTRTGSFGATSGALDVAAKVDGSWQCQRGSMPAMVGRNGTRPILDRRSGDGTAPAGVFPLGTTTAWDGQAFQFFGNGADPGVRGVYRAVQAGDCWGARPNTATYNHLYRSTACPSPDEYLPSITGAYVHAAVIGANTEPAVSGDAPGETPYAAAIFLHRHAYTPAGVVKPTSGCVSLAIEDLVPTLALIDPALTPMFAVGPTDWLRTTA